MFPPIRPGRGTYVTSRLLAQVCCHTLRCILLKFRLRMSHFHTKMSHFSSDAISPCRTLSTLFLFRTPHSVFLIPCNVSFWRQMSHSPAFDLEPMSHFQHAFLIPHSVFPIPCNVSLLRFACRLLVKTWRPDPMQPSAWRRASCIKPESRLTAIFCRVKIFVASIAA